MQHIDVNLTVDLDEPAAVPEVSEIITWARAAFEVAQFARDCNFSVTFVSDEIMQEYNSTYRGINKTTNILSFPTEPEVDELELLSSEISGTNQEELLAELKEIKENIGDLIVSYHKVVNEAQEQNKSFTEHCAHLIIHGCLHLIGYDHIEDDEAEVMESLEIKALALLNYANPYADDEV